MPLDLTNDNSTLVQVMAWWRQAISHYLSQFSPRFMSPYGVTRPQWVKSLSPEQSCSESRTKLARVPYSLQCHNQRHGITNHRRLNCLSNRMFRRRSNKTSKLRVTGLCEGNSPLTDEFPAQISCNAENVSISWRYHVFGEMMGANPKVLSKRSQCLCQVHPVLKHVFRRRTCMWRTHGTAII